MTSSVLAPAGRPTRRAVLVAAALVWLCPRTARGETAPEAESFIRNVGNRAVEVLNAGGEDTASRRRRMAALLDEAVDVPMMARLALGRHWRTISDAQRADHLRLFRAYLLTGLSARLGGAGGERFIVKYSRPARDDDSIVGTQVHLEPGQPPADVEWRVRRGPDGYRIVDVIAQGVSLVVTNRAEFDAIIVRRGFDGLLEQMRRWAAEAGQS